MPCNDPSLNSLISYAMTYTELSLICLVVFFIIPFAFLWVTGRLKD